MLTFIFAIIGLIVVIGLISMLGDLENSIISCVIGIIGIFVLYGLVTGAMDLFFWLGYQIGAYSILVMILIIACPILLIIFYDDIKSKFSKIKKPKGSFKPTNEWKTCPICGHKLIKVQKKCPYCNHKFE